MTMKIIFFLIISLFSQSWAVSADQSKADAVAAYIAEFSNAGESNYPKIHEALNSALNKLPEEVFVKVTDRNYPVLFVVNLTSGIGRFANSLEFSFKPGDPSAFKNGFYLIKLSDELESQESVEAIEGIVLHELAHDYLGHLKRSEFSCQMEKEANRQIKEWGFEKEFQQAKEKFGSKEPGDSPCH